MKWLYGILCLGFIVFFHELGHFLAAKLFGVKVESFSLGYGPAILHHTFKGTDYRLSLFPLGGYCGMKGEKEFSEAIETGADSVNSPPDSMYGIHPLKRAAIAFAGPFFNLFFAFAAFVVISMVGYTYYSYSAKIKLADELYPEIHSAARDAGLRSGDIITQINGKKISSFSDVITEIATRPDETVTIQTDRGGQILTFKVHTDLDKKEGSGKIGVTAADTTPVKYDAQTYSFFPALYNGLKQTGNYFALTVKGLSILFKGVDLSSSVSGPARITDMLGDTVKEGFSAGFRNGLTAMLEFMAFISISLFVMNLLPIPVLDGGLILFAIIQVFTHRQIKPKTQVYIQYAGLAVIAVIFCIGLFGDITYFAGILRGSK